MKELNYWQQFMSTGKVEDYLSYKRQKEQEQGQVKGEHPYAGTFQCDRTHFEGGTFRGI
ncbi:MAG: hypothetical protein IJ029_01430 [Lachnospiraceae bacterium]|nr:hypothetical protein [Lachnospiraceae bacterium]MBQ8877364.1 hypothetical protein [Lachnospiraceae bacterium]